MVVVVEGFEWYVDGGDFMFVGWVYVDQGDVVGMYQVVGIVYVDFLYWFGCIWVVDGQVFVVDVVYLVDGDVVGVMGVGQVELYVQVVGFGGDGVFVVWGELEVWLEIGVDGQLQGCVWGIGQCVFEYFYGCWGDGDVWWGMVWCGQVQYVVQFVVGGYLQYDVVVVDQFVVDVQLWDGWLVVIGFDVFMDFLVGQYVDVGEFDVQVLQGVYGFG